jgi:hypothetical protein
MKAHAPGGTRFRLFPEYDAGYLEPEAVVLSPPLGSLGPGPADAAMYVANAVDKITPYDPPLSMPPWRGPEYAPALPGPDGNFSHIPVDTQEFLGAHLYGCIRFTLDVWERYLHRHVTWWHAAFLPQIELVPVVRNWRNAHSGPGFIEAGTMVNRFGLSQLLCLNFDVVSHETGHAILFSQVGVPTPGAVSSEYLAFHESFSDLIGLVACLEFRSVARKLLQQTGGNLYVLNLVTRLGEISDTEQVRIASNTATMADVAGLHVLPDGSWHDPLGLNRNQHALAEPLTGAIFDCLVEIYQDLLVAQRLIPPDLDARGWSRAEVAASFADVRRGSARAFAAFDEGFLLSLDTARDMIGECMAHVILTVTPETLTFGLAAARFLEAAFELGQRANLWALMNHFLARGIDPRPYLAEPVARRAHRLARPRRLLRAVDPAASLHRCVCCDPLAFIHAHRLMPHPHRAEVT